MENTEETKTFGKSAEPSVWKNALNYGMYTGGAYILFALLLYALDVNRESLVNYLGYAIIIAGIVMGTIHYRDKINNGHITFGKALGTGVIISLIVGVIGAIYAYLLFTYIDPTLAAQMLETVEQKLYDQGLSDEMIDQQLAMTKKFMSPVALTITSILGTVIVGTIVSLVTSAILKRTDDSFNATFQE